MEENMIIYYYCSLQTFYKILIKQSILLTDMTKSNDADEFCFIFELYKKYLYKKFGEKASMSIEFNDAQFKNSNTNIIPMARCFTTKHDDLLMWGEYGDRGKGVCIGFNVDKLKSILSNVSFKENNLELKQITYIDKNTEDMQKLDELFKDCKDNKYIINNYSELLRLSLFHKNKEFELEDEWRIGINTFASKGTISGTSLKLEFSDNLGFFIEVPITLDSISEIILGPKCEYNLNDITTVFKYFYGDDFDYKLNNIVIKSKIPLKRRG